MPSSRLFWDSIRGRAALLTSIIVTVALTAFTWYTVARVEADLIKRGIERAETAATVLAAQTAQTSQLGVARLNEIARDAAVRACALSPTDDAKRAVIASVVRAGGPAQEQTIALWDARGHLVLDTALPPQAAAMMPTDPAPPAAVGLMPLQTHGDVLFTRIAADVPGDARQPSAGRVGSLVISHVVHAAASSAVLNSVVGGGATLLVGNRSGPVWTDLSRIVPAPAMDLTRPGGREFRASNGEAQIGAPASIVGTPWVLLLAFPRSVIVAPARQLLGRLIAAGVVFVLVATFAAGALSRRVTKPLGELTRAAQAIARGDYSHRVVTSRRDEVGQLGHAFNAMAERVESGRTALEARAAELSASREIARHANQAKDEFLAVLSHELRTPLNAILGWCHMLSEGVVPAGGTTHALSVIERNAAAQLRLVEDLLDVSRIVAGRFVLDTQLVDPATVVHTATESIQPLAIAKDIVLTIDVSPKAGAGFVHGDPGRLQQAVWNLLSNAIKFTPYGGSVSVCVRYVGASVEIVVRDSGEGISREALPLIFERLHQGDNRRARRHGGLGLGLAIARQVIDLHHGTISAESDGPGHGATFRIELPTANAQAIAASHMLRSPFVVSGAFSDAGGPSVRGLRVLVIEDADDARELLNRLLTGQGAIVTTARDATIALGWLERNHADMIISDIEMPGLNGLEMMRRIRSQPTTVGGFVPAIALTAYVTAEDRERSLASGFQVHLTKPVDFTELLMTIASLVAAPQEYDSSSRTPIRQVDHRPHHANPAVPSVSEPNAPVVGRIQ